MALRKSVPRKSLAAWSPPLDRPDPIDLIRQSHQGRLEWLIPIRVGRMVTSPYGFLRGTAIVMAEDVARLPATGITPVICGDAHLGNFGFYASPEGELVIDLNDFDEAHPGCWEWDLRRLVASIWVAGRENSATEEDCHAAVAVVRDAYREELRFLAEQPLLQRCYNRLDVGGCTRRQRRSRCGTRSNGRPSGPAPEPVTGRCRGSPRSTRVCVGSSRNRR